MPISFKSSAKVPELLAHLGLPPDMFQPSYTLDMGISEVRVVNEHVGALIATVKPGTLISSLLKLSSTHPSCLLLRDLLIQVEHHIKKFPNENLGVCDAAWLKVNIEPDLFVKSTWTDEDDDWKIPGDSPFVDPEDVDPITAAVEKSFAKLKVEEGIKQVLSEADIKLILKSPMVPLRDATKLYQPVLGTSEGARYYVIGISKDGIKVAIKNPSSSISVRVEAKNSIPAHAVSALGHFGISQKGNYMSGHFALSHSTPTRFVGALLMDMGLEWITPLPNVKLLESAQ